MKSDNGKPQT